MVFAVRYVSVCSIVCALLLPWMLLMLWLLLLLISFEKKKYMALIIPFALNKINNITNRLPCRILLSLGLSSLLLLPRLEDEHVTGNNVTFRGGVNGIMFYMS